VALFDHGFLPTPFADYDIADCHFAGVAEIVAANFSFTRSISAPHLQFLPVA